MPLLATPTTVDLLQEAFVAALAALVPRMTRGSEDRWQYIAREQAPSMGSRLYRFEWEYEGLTEGGYMWRGGASVDMTCTLVVDYGGVPDEALDALAQDDHQQVGDVLDRLRVTTDGLRRVLSIRWGRTESSSPDQAQVAHQYRVRYLQARAS